MIKRRLAREVAAQALYAWDIGQDAPEEVAQRIIHPPFFDDVEHRRFAEKLFFSAVKSFTEYEREIDDQVDNWDVKRLARLDKLIIKIALAEFETFADIPVKVSINEAIEVAKKFSTDHSGKFVNGILDAIRQRWVQEKRIQKTGRGLIDSTLGKK